MSPIDQAKPVVAFFGATGGTVATTLGLALNAGYTAYALARTPEKLTTLLSKEHAVSPSTIEQYLTIVKGDVTEPADVAAALKPEGKPAATTIVSGIGGSPFLQPSLMTPVNIHPANICADGMRAVLAAVDRLRSQGHYPPLKPQDPSRGQSPLIITVSTTGADQDRRDIPLAYTGLYHWLLQVPHADKAAMESELARSGTPFIILRPTLLTDGEGLGQDKVAVGWVRHKDAQGSSGRAEDDGKGQRPAIGYTIRRRDVGTWAFEQGIVNGGADWVGKCVTLTS